MPYPATIDNWYDHSGITSRQPVERWPRPVFLAAAAFDRGPENIVVTHGQDFYKTFGYYIDFDKYGQAAIQVANAIDNGADVMLKRIVANDATLANAVVVANVELEKIQKTDSEGNLLYEDQVTLGETTDDNGGLNQPIMINNAKISIETLTITDKKNLAEVVDAAKDLLVQDDEENKYTYPLFVVTDNGRGESTKRFAVEPQYVLSKNQRFMLYKFKYLGSKDLDYEEVYFALKPGIMYLGKSMDIGMACTEMIQCKTEALTNSIDLFYAKVAEFSGMSETDVFACDVLFARNKKGEVTQGLTLDEESVNLNADIGFSIESGSNGIFADCPIEHDEYEQALLEFFDGTFDEDIYNLDTYKIDAVIDAAYPLDVKKAIVELAKFRKDFMFFGDLGLEVNTYTNAVSKMYEMPKDKFTAWYAQTFQVINPFTQRKIDVTMGYALSRLLVDHFNNRVNAPFCGILYNFTIPEAIEGSVNFTPHITPKYNQKQELMDIHLNFASYYNNILTLESTFTSQEEDTQLSYINNVASIQEIIKTIREACPSSRYTFLTGGDLSRYKNDVDNILNRYSDWFESLEFVYVQDDIMKANKIFEADIMIKHKDFIQQEVFNIYTLGVEQAVEASANTSLTESYYV